MSPSAIWLSVTIWSMVDLPPTKGLGISIKFFREAYIYWIISFQNTRSRPPLQHQIVLESEIRTGTSSSIPTKVVYIHAKFEFTNLRQYYNQAFSYHPCGVCFFFYDQR